MKIVGTILHGSETLLAVDRRCPLGPNSADPVLRFPTRVSEVSHPPIENMQATSVKTYANVNLSAKAVPKTALPARPMTQLEYFQWNTDLRPMGIALIYHFHVSQVSYCPN